MAGSFRKLSDVDMDRLSTEELIAHLVRAREDGQAEQATLALRMFVFRFEPLIHGRVAGKVPEGEVEPVVSAVFKSVFEQVFGGEREPWSGESEASCRAWVFTIVQRRIADFYKKPTMRMVPLPEEHAEADDIFGADAATSADETGAVEVVEIAERCLAELAPAHRLVIALAIFDDLAAKDVVERVNREHPELEPPMSTDNVDQVKSRFRSRVRAMLEGDD